MHVNDGAVFAFKRESHRLRNRGKTTKNGQKLRQVSKVKSRYQEDEFLPQFRAFISHSSRDKEFADIIFAQLDRASVIYDRHEFDDGDVLTDEIVARIAACGVFVFLGSTVALTSKWVNLELQAAQSLREAGLMNDTLLFALEGVVHSDFPKWLQGLSVTPAINPHQVAVAIRDMQINLIDRIQNPIFLNRHQEVEAAEQHLQNIGPNTSMAHKVIAFFGQAGFGRRSLARIVLRNACGLTKDFTLRFESGDNLRDLIIKLAQYSAKYETREELQIAIDEISSSTEDELDRKLEEHCSRLVSTNTALFIEDQGGLLDADGFLHPTSANLINAVEKTPGCYAVIITRRKPHRRVGLSVPSVAVGDLQPDVAAALVGKYAENVGLRIKSNAERDLVATRVGGHPAALMYFVNLAREYGIDTILADKAFVTNHNIERYWHEIKADGTLSPLHKLILAVLALYGTANLDVLSSVLDADRTNIAVAIRHLIELVLVTVDPTGQYHLCSALFDVVPRLFPDIRINHDRVYQAFTEYLAENPDVDNRLDFERSRSVAASLGNSPVGADRLVMLASDYVKIADKAYRDEKYKVAFDYAELSIRMRPGNFIAIRTYIQAGVKRRLFAEACACLDDNVDKMQAHESENFAGIIARGKGLYEEALNHFRRASDFGRRGLAIHRDLSLCFYKLGYIPDAEHHLRLAFREVYGANNEYLLDLGIRIAISKGDESQARTFLSDSHVYDKPHHALMLEAAVELVFGDPAKATDCLVAIGNRLPYFGRYLKIVADLRLNDLASARHAIQGIAKSADPVDVRLLETALLWSRGRHDEAKLHIDHGDAALDSLRYRELYDFISANNVTSDLDARRELTRILINQGARSSKN